jgi:hypothetical protein
MSDIKDETELKFDMTFGDAKVIVAALGKLPMEAVEPLVNKLRMQVEKQLADMQAQPAE